MSTFIEVGTLAALVIITWHTLRHNNPSLSMSRVAAPIVGIFAGLLGGVHGVYEILQGNVAPGELLIHAIGPPCQPEAEWHACLPAITIVPSFLVSGMLVLILMVIIVVWAARFVQRKRGGLVLMGLSIVLLLVGGGFFPMFYGIIAGSIGSRIDTSSS